MSSLAALFGTLLYAASASAATSPAAVAYGAVSSAISSNGGAGGAGTGTTSSGSLPFTGLNLVVILGVAVVLLAIGFTVRIRAAKSN